MRKDTYLVFFDSVGICANCEINGLFPNMITKVYRYFQLPLPQQNGVYHIESNVSLSRVRPTRVFN